MSRFLQLHLLTSYPPANLNRDDLGKPKTAMMGGVQRLRISSQSLKRAWRTSDTFGEVLKGSVGTRTKRMGQQIYERLSSKGVTDANAKKWAALMAGVFGKNKKESLEIEQLTHFSPEEIAKINALADRLATENRAPEETELDLLVRSHRTADIALFGRMLASSPNFNTEAAAQVAHAITVHSVAVEDDFFSAVDDLNTHEVDAGAAHLGETGFAAGVFYLYLCIDCQSLVQNLSADIPLAQKTLRALVEAAARVAPTGKQNSFASRAYASYLLAERGDQQPRSLSVAYLKPVTGANILKDAIKALEECVTNMDTVYGPTSDKTCRLNTVEGTGSLPELLAFAEGACQGGA